MSGVLFDTSVYIDALRSGSGDAAGTRGFINGHPVWLSSVVLHELYAGVRERDARTIEKLEYDFVKAGRVLVPSLNDWAKAGKALAYLRANHGYEAIGQSRLTNDALIAMSAARSATTVITRNEKDFARLEKFVRFSWRLIPRK